MYLERQENLIINFMAAKIRQSNPKKYIKISNKVIKKALIEWLDKYILELEKQILNGTEDI